MLKCIIVDDEQSAIDVLKMHIEETSSLQLVAATTNPKEALALINAHPIELAFLDITMPGISGIELARAMQGKCRVIFTTAHAKYVSQSYEVDALDYLLKPVPLPRFMMAVQRAINIMQPSHPANSIADGIKGDYLFLRTEQKGKMLRIDLVDIDYVEGMKNYVAIHHCGQKTQALLGLNEMQERLPGKHFVRVQKSFIVAMHKIAMVEGNRVKLKNVPTEIIVGDAYKAQFMEALKDRVM
jgi:two-component system, LytTR family, response regulator